MTFDDGKRSRAMSTQTGIRANDALSDFFGKCRSGRYRDRLLYHVLCK